MRAAPSRAHVICGAVGGGVFGAVISVVVNNALIEISLTPFFASVFGCVLMLLGVLMCWRKLWEDHQHPLMRLLVLAFSGLVLLSAVSCFLLEKDWFRTIPPNAKVPLYMSLGVSLSFAVTFSLVDLLNLYSDHCRSRAVPLVASSRQIGLVLLGAVAMGALFGFMFGAMDVEDDGVVKVYVTLEGDLAGVGDDAVDAKFDKAPYGPECSMEVRVRGAHFVHVLAAERLCGVIVPGECKHKVTKKGKLVVTMKKAHKQEPWEQLRSKVQLPFRRGGGGNPR